MKLYSRYCPRGFSNCYILGSDFDESGEGGAPREAVVIDPGVMDERILHSIEHHRYSLVAALITHGHKAHVEGLRALKRIYDVDIYSASEYVLDYKTRMVRDGDVIRAGSSFEIEAISVPGHSVDSVVYKTANLLFTGDALSAGLLGSAASSFGAMRQISTIRNKIFALPGNMVVLPGHGPPSTLDVERAYNVDISLFQEQMSKSERADFNLDFLD